VKVEAILKHKGQSVLSIHPRATLAEVVQRLVDHNCGSLLVLDGETLVGIITERDILRTCASDTRALGAIQVHEKMSRNLVTARSDDELNDIMGLLTDRRVRHLPILEEGSLRGIISIGDVVKAQHDELSMENHYLKNYLHS
jgi:CBS domain-containing protein